MNEKILIVDDSKEVAELLKLNLTHEFNVYLAHSGADGLALFKQHDFTVALLDIEMPGMSGFDVIQQMHQIKCSRETSVIFYSAHDNEETVVKCFDLGGDDFVSKASDISLVAQKIKALVKYKRLIDCLSNEEHELENLIDTTLMQASFYGRSVELMAEIQQADTEEHIAALIFTFIQQQGLSSSIEFRRENRLIQLDQKNKFCSPMEKQIFELLKNKGRIYEFGSRLMLNDKHISLFIKVMPDKSTADYGLLIDVLAKLVPAIEMRYLALLNSQQMQVAQVALQDAIKNIQSAMHDLQEERKKLIDDITMQIGFSFHELEFTEQQEQYLHKVITESISAQDSQDDRFVKISKRLRKLINDMQEAELAQNTNKDQSTAAITADIELF